MCVECLRIHPSHLVIFAPSMLSSAQVDKIIYAFSTVLTRIINGRKNLRTMTFNRILIIRLDEIGDLCYTGPALEALRQRFPAAEITLWCKPFARGLVHDHPALSYIVSDRKELSGHYDLIIDMRGSWTGLGYALMHKPVARLDRGTVRLRNKRKGQHPHEIETNFEVIHPLLADDVQIPEARLYPSSDDRISAAEFIRANNLRSFAVIHPGARRELRRWPLQRYAEVAVFLKEEFGLDTVIAGDRSELQLTNDLAALIPFKTYSTCGVLNLGAFAALMQHAAFFAGNESGPLHIAALSGTPSLGLFGPGEPRVFYPRGNHTALLHHVLPCNPCDQIHCVHPENPCIQRITVADVFGKIKLLLQAEVNS